MRTVTNRPSTGAATGGVALVVGSAFVLHLVLAPLRRLSGDEAYYLCASRSQWPISDHPPLLGALLALVDHLLAALPVVLRVRALAAALQLCTTLGIVALVDALVERKGEAARARWSAAVLASYGLFPMAGGLLTTPDAPLLAALAWLFAILARSRESSAKRYASLSTPLLLFGFALLAGLAKVTGLVVVLLAAFETLRRRRLRDGLALLLGALAVAPIVATSLRLQISHALGHGPLISAPRLGALAAVSAFVFGQLALFSPAVVFVALGRAGRDTFRRAPAASLSALVLLGLCLVSAIISGRPPEPSWTAPLGIALFAVAAAVTAPLRPLRRAVLAIATVPTCLAVALWALPGPFASLAHDIDPLRKVPHVGEDPGIEPPYAAAARRCVELLECDEIHYIFDRYTTRLTANSQWRPGH